MITTHSSLILQVCPGGRPQCWYLWSYLVELSMPWGDMQPVSHFLLDRQLPDSDIHAVMTDQGPALCLERPVKACPLYIHSWANSAPEMFACTWTLLTRVSTPIKVIRAS